MYIQRLFESLSPLSNRLFLTFLLPLFIIPERDSLDDVMLSIIPCQAYPFAVPSPRVQYSHTLSYYISFLLWAHLVQLIRSLSLPYQYKAAN